MSVKFLLDENVDPLYRVQLLKRNPDLTVWKVGDPDTPPRGTLDPDILIWCEKNSFILVTNNRTSMPPHLQDHLVQERRVPGIVILNPGMTIGQTIENLVLIADNSDLDEYRDKLTYMPVTRPLS